MRRVRHGNRARRGTGGDEGIDAALALADGPMPVAATSVRAQAASVCLMAREGRAAGPSPRLAL